MSRSVVVAILCDAEGCAERVAAGVGERLGSVEARARAAGWQIGPADRCRAHRTVVPISDYAEGMAR